MLNPSTHFSPIRMEAYVRNEVEMELSVKNDGGTPRWVEAWSVCAWLSLSLRNQASQPVGKIFMGRKR